MPDLEARARVFVDAMAQLDQGVLLAFLAPDGEVEYPGALGPLSRDAFAALLRTLRGNLEAMRIREVEYRADRVLLQGDTTAVEWSGSSLRNGEPATYRGSTFLTWSADGLVLRAAIYTDPAMVRRYSVGWTRDPLDAAAQAEAELWKP